MAITDHTLKDFFPMDFYKRCMYAAFGVAALLEDDGIVAQVVGGDYLCAVVSEDGGQLSLQGFGTKGYGEPSHFWVHAQGCFLDLGPMYLPFESSFRAAPLPVLRWPLSAKLPDFMVYKERGRYSAISTPELKRRNEDFVARCRSICKSQGDQLRLGTWQLKDIQSLQYAARKGDTWARAATVFLQRRLKAAFPNR